jgi:tRNA uridine 5-carboxymethylaminomethyl modification enzyme
LKDRAMGDGLLRRPEIGWAELCELGFAGTEAPADVWEQVEIQTKYEGYIRRDLELLAGMRKNEGLQIPKATDFDAIPGLSTEIRARLREVRPETIGQASRLQGVTPAVVANLMIFLKMQGSRSDRLHG